MFTKHELSMLSTLVVHACKITKDAEDKAIVDADQDIIAMARRTGAMLLTIEMKLLKAAMPKLFPRAYPKTH